MTVVTDLRGPLAGKFRFCSNHSAFTLIELLSVLVIIAIISALAFTSIPLMLKANQIDSSAAVVTGILDLAHEAAISSNTYVWVAFTDPSANSSFHGIWVATILSQDGTESPINTGTASAPIWATSITIPGNNLQLLNKIQSLPGVSIVDATALPSALTSQAPASATALFEGSVTWTVTPLQNSTSSTIYFTHAIEFAPNGNAHVPTWNSNIQFGLVPIQGSTTNAILFNVSRFTGKATSYRR